MNRGPLLFFGILFTLATSFWGMLLVPEIRLGHQTQVTNELNGALYPQARAGLARKGADVYRSYGCQECHTLLVRGTGLDLVRGWGPRRTVAQDYLGDNPVMLGQLRVGPDLANIGLRRPDRTQLFLQLYDPQRVTPGSMMPPYRDLFETRKIRPGQQRSAIALGGIDKPGEEVVPGADAEALVAYLLSLHSETSLFEAPVAKGAPSAKGTNAAAGGTNAAVPSTNSPGTTNRSEPATGGSNAPAAPPPAAPTNSGS